MLNGMHRRTALTLLASAILLAGTSFTRDARAAEVIKIGTLAPKASPWGQVLNVWAEAVKKNSNGGLELQFFYGGQQGDESAMVGKMKAGQLDGALVTAVGLGKIYKPILALQMPGLFRTWEKVEAARDAMRTELEKGAKDAGFTMLGWTHFGAARVFSKGFEVRSPDALKGKKPFMWRDDVAQPSFFEAIGGVTPVPLNVQEVLPQLDTGAIDAVVAPSLLAEQLQWASKLDNVVDDVAGYSIGGIVLSSKRLAALPADLVQILASTGKTAAAALTTRIRSEDDAAFTRCASKMKVVKLTADEKTKWDAFYKQVRQRLAQGTFAPELVTKLETLAK